MAPAAVDAGSITATARRGGGARRAVCRRAAVPSAVCAQRFGGSRPAAGPHDGCSGGQHEPPRQLGGRRGGVVRGELRHSRQAAGAAISAAAARARNKPCCPPAGPTLALLDAPHFNPRSVAPEMWLLGTW